MAFLPFAPMRLDEQGTLHGEVECCADRVADKIKGTLPRINQSLDQYTNGDNLSLTQCPDSNQLSFLNASSCPKCERAFQSNMLRGKAGAKRARLHDKVRRVISRSTPAWIGDTALCGATGLQEQHGCISGVGD